MQLDDSDSENNSEVNDLPIRRKPNFRPRLNWENLSRAEFIERFRMAPSQADQLLNIIGRDIEPIRFTNHALTAKQKLCAAMRFFGTNAPLFAVGDGEHISKATAHRCVIAVANAIINNFQNKWPNNENECRLIATQFFHKSKGRFGNLPGFVNCCGAIDGSLFTIVAPSNDEHLFVDRKGHHSLNAQGVCGPDLRFFSFSINFPGSVNDARVFRRSGLYRHFDRGYRPFPNAIMVGDAAYPSLNFLVPMRNFGAEWTQFYEAHARTRTTIENCWALLKNRFCCLKGPLRLKEPRDNAEIIKCLAILHNFLLENKEENDMPTNIDESNEDSDDEAAVGEDDLNLNELQNLLNHFKIANNII